MLVSLMLAKRHLFVIVLAVNGERFERQGAACEEGNKKATTGAGGAVSIELAICQDGRCRLPPAVWVLRGRIISLNSAHVHLALAPKLAAGYACAASISDR
jgi:hypothetical protein